MQLAYRRSWENRPPVKMELLKRWVLPIAVIFGIFFDLGCGRKDRIATVPGELVVGFSKDVSSVAARKILEELKLRYLETNDLNAGQTFFYDTGAKFIVYVPSAEENAWLERLEKNQHIARVARHNDPKKGIVD